MSYRLHSRSMHAGSCVVSCTIVDKNRLCNLQGFLKLPSVYHDSLACGLGQVKIDTRTLKAEEYLIILWARSYAAACNQIYHG